MHAVTALDHALSPEGGDPTRLVRFGAAFGTVHLDLLPEEFAVLFDLFGEVDLGVAEAAAVAVEVGALEGRFGGGRHAAVGDEGGHLTHDGRVIDCYI